MQFKELTVEELTRGYIRSEEKDAYICIFCGETFSEGIIFKKGERFVTAQRAVKEHVAEEHGGAFNGLIDLDKQISGLSDIQKNILRGLYEEKDNKTLGREMGISDATVRTHKFNIQKMKREARILLAILENIENENLKNERAVIEEQLNKDAAGQRHGTDDLSVERSLTGNSLHPFFTQFYLK